MAYAQPNPAPGREGSNPAPAQPQPATQAPEGSPAAAPPQGGLDMFLMPVLLIGMVVFMIWSSRGQAKKQQQLMESLKAGDKIVTKAGLLGKLDEVTDRTVRVEIAPGVKVTMLKASVEGIDAGDTKKETK